MHIVDADELVGGRESGQDNHVALMCSMRADPGYWRIL